ncbi:recombinase family protein [Shewanella algae]|uniref:recombinase family protein n=1 Tax=Shewanella algae TaxID=38313 RepID=UPI003AAE596A
MATIFGYARVSTTDQNYQTQIDAIRGRYPEAVIRSEKATGTKRGQDTRPVLEILLEMLGNGDRLVVVKLDRLARNMLDLLNIVEQLKAKGAFLEVLDQQIDTSTASGVAFLGMLGVFAEFETNLRRERQQVGIEAAKKRGVYKGRPENIELKIKIRELRATGLSLSKCAKAANCSLSTVQRALKD